VELTPKILVVGSDPKLITEVEAAISVISDLRAVLSTAPDFRRGLETVRNRRPDMVLVEMTSDLDSLKLFVEEVTLASSETRIVAAYAPNLFGGNLSETTMFIEAVRSGVQDFLARPLSSTDFDRYLDRAFRRISVEQGATGRIVTFCSNKGGVGKSTMSVNVACGLAKRHPKKVLLVDASLQMGSCAPMLDIRPATTLTDAVRERDRLDETLLRELAVSHSCGLDLLAAPLSAVEAAEVDDHAISLILTLARRTYDYIVVDTFPMLDRTMMAVLDLTDLAYVVTESVMPTLIGATRLLTLLDELGFPLERRRIVLNRYSTFAGNLKVEVVTKQIGQKVDHVIPYQKKLLISANLGSPYVLNHSPVFSSFSGAVKTIIDEIDAMKPIPPGARFGRGGRPRAATDAAATPVDQGSQSR
jgi:pilus assembly protein CpaE